MRPSFSLKTLAWCWGIVLTGCAAGAVTLQVLDVVPAPEPLPVLPAAVPAAAQPPVAAQFAAVAVPPAAPAAPPVVAPPPVPVHVAPPRPRLAERLPVPPVPPRSHEIRPVHEVREARVMRRPVVRYAAAPAWRPPMEPQPYWRGVPYPGQYYAYREPWPRMPGPYYGWGPAE